MHELLCEMNELRKQINNLYYNEKHNKFNYYTFVTYYAKQRNDNSETQIT